MQAVAHARFEKISSEKANAVLRLVRGRGVDEALVVLANVPRKAAVCALKTLRSAVANAGQKKLNLNALWVHTAYANFAPSNFRKPEYRAQGRMNFMRKPLSHLTVIVSDEPAAKRGR